MMRSGFSPAKSWTRPASSEPTSASAGTRTSSKKSANCFSHATNSVSIFLYSNESVGTTKSAGLSLPVRASAVRATTRTA
jgi:hypothetical protein